MRSKERPQIEIVAELIDEPSSDAVVPLLEALSAEESAYYADEEQVVDLESKSQVLFEEVEERFGFVGGRQEEYIRYFHRRLPAQMWEWTTADDVKAIAGFSAVRKKPLPSGVVPQRKLLMCCAANYAFRDARQREDHGLGGGGGLASLEVVGDAMDLACFDESNAFTAVLMPPW
jgi:hypothetical protein